MNTQESYKEHSGKAVEMDERFERVMAITLDPKTNFKKGVLRCVTSWEGDVQVKGFVYRSILSLVEGDSLEHFKIKERLAIKNEKEIMESLVQEGQDFIGFEDPDIWVDEETGLTHLYFTIPIRLVDAQNNRTQMHIHLGHAVGKDLESLKMTAPVLLSGEYCAKEVSIAPLNSKGFRYNLIESRDRVDDTTYSVVQVAVAHDMGSNWEYGDIVFHPKEHNIAWIAGHASPGPLLPKSLIDVGEGKLLGIMNGREANQEIDGKTKYGMFSVGLFIYDYEKGKIDWVSPEPFIQDSEALTITFASQFVETESGKGILYAHVDDSFVRAYTLNAEMIKSLLPLRTVD